MSGDGVKRHPLFKPGHFTIHPGVIQGGPSGVAVPFIISQYCTIEYACWFHPDEDVDAVKEELERNWNVAVPLTRGCEPTRRVLSGSFIGRHFRRAWKTPSWELSRTRISWSLVTVRV